MNGSEDLCSLSATRLAPLLREREISAVEVVQSALARIEESEGAIHAWEVVDGKSSIEAAQRADRRLRTRRGRALEGVPFGVKDIFDVVGLPTKAGLPGLVHPIARRDAVAVARLRRAGAIVLGKMVTTQLAWTDPAATINPWDATRTPGASSAGPAAGVAARHIPIALVSQTAGSTLRPAAYCGVVGFKPSRGRGSTEGSVPLARTLDQIGGIAREVADLRLWLAAVDGRRPADPPTLSRPRLGILRASLRIAESSTRSAFLTTIDRLSTAGAAALDIPFPDFDLALAVHRTILLSQAAASHAHLLDTHREYLQPNIAAHLRVGSLVQAPAYIRAERLRVSLVRRADWALRRVDALLLPTTPTVAPLRETTGDSTLQAPFSLLGLPALTIPMGLSPEGLPFGLQLIGRTEDDDRLLVLGEWCTDILGFPRAPTGGPAPRGRG